jgi:hypothetical protein
MPSTAMERAQRDKKKKGRQKKKHAKISTRTHGRVLFTECCTHTAFDVMIALCTHNWICTVTMAFTENSLVARILDVRREQRRPTFCATETTLVILGITNVNAGLAQWQRAGETAGGGGGHRCRNRAAAEKGVSVV